MRPWDNFFWWLEAEGLPPKSMVAPGNWPPPQNRAARPRSKANAWRPTRSSSTCRPSKVTVWLSPELVDFGSSSSSKSTAAQISPRDRIVRPDLTVLLEDVRTRADRQHPFWAKLTTQ